MLIFWLIAALGGLWLALGLIRAATEPHYQAPSWLWLTPVVVAFWALIAAVLS